MSRDNLFSKENIEHVRQMRSLFFENGSEQGITGIRPEILLCWKMAYIAGVRTLDERKPRLEEAEFELVKQKSAKLLETAQPYMEVLAEFFEEKSFWLTLLDSDGVVLKIVGSGEAVEHATRTGLYEGSFRGLNTSCTGLFSACWYYDKPFQMVATEHSSTVDDELAGAATPIYDKETGERLGIIGISGFWWEAHEHTLGLTIMAAEAISQQLALKRQHRRTLSVNKRLDTVLENMDMGVIYFQKNGDILTANQSAVHLLEHDSVSKTDFVKKRIFAYLEKDILPERMEYIDEIIEKKGEFSFEMVPAGKYAPLHGSIRKVNDEEGTYLVQLQKRSQLKRMAESEGALRARYKMEDLIGSSEKMKILKETAQVAARYSPTIMILGESGTGKELLAQAIHNAGARARGPFVAVNCGAIPQALLESELFGYEAGAFTGAQKSGKAGKFEQANGGTLFLDEIGDMPFEAQVSLLRALQTKEIVRVGGRKPIRIDIMVIAATHQNLEEKIRQGLFREDLYYRLNVFSLQMPPLRERVGDVGLLAEYFLNKYCHEFDKRIAGISKKALAMLDAYHWPGNVRELENVIERSIILCREEYIGEEDLRLHSKKLSETEEPKRSERLLLKEEDRSLRDAEEIFVQSDEEDGQVLGQYERERLKNLLLQYNGNLSRVAKELGVSRPTLYRRLKKCGLYDKIHTFHLE